MPDHSPSVWCYRKGRRRAECRSLASAYQRKWRTGSAVEVGHWSTFKVRAQPRLETWSRSELLAAREAS